MAMPDFLQQLVSMGPAIGAGVSGNGDNMAAFMEGYQKTLAQIEAKKRQGQMDSLALEDRQRGIDRQATADARLTEDRTRSLELQKLDLMPRLAERGATAETPEDAQRIIEAAMPGLMKAFGQDTMGLGMPAIDMATRTITGRQKKQVSDFVEAALKTSFVADNPDADPEIANLPDHVARAIGKPSAKLSELQMFAQLPVGKPAGKTRVPPAAGSMEEFSDPSTPPERKAAILADRKAYMQSDDKPTVQVNLPGGISSKAGDAALKFQDDYARDSKPYLTMREAYQRVKSAKPDAAGDLSLIFAYMKILDPNSVVREQEFANAQNAAGVPDQVRNLYNRVMEGTRLNPEQRKQFQAQAEALFEGARTNQKQVRGTYGKRAKQWGIPENMVLDEEDEYLRPPAPAAPPKVGSVVRDKKTGQLVEVTGVRPDGSLIVKPRPQ